MTEKWEYNGVEFKPGDRVKVVRMEEDFAPNGMGQGIHWENVWVHREASASRDEEPDAEKGMDGAYGHEFVINHIDEAGVVFTDFVDNGFNAFAPARFAYPLSVLEKLQ